MLLISCSKSCIQIFDTETMNTNVIENNYVFENDTVKINYSFWASKGVMSFSIYNKLNDPLYIDWKNSSFIVNDKRLNYWVDEEQSSETSYYGAYFYNGALLKSGFSVTKGTTLTSSSTVKPERIALIPPKSFLTRSQFYLLPVEYYKLNKNCNKSIEPRNDNPNKNTTIFFETFSNSNSPLRFRNYIAISFKEYSQDFRFIDNAFYLASIKEMDLRHFQGKKVGRDEKGKFIYEEPYKKMTSYFIRIKNIDSYDYRDWSKIVNSKH